MHDSRIRNLFSVIRILTGIMITDVEGLQRPLNINEAWQEAGSSS